MVSWIRKVQRRHAQQFPWHVRHVLGYVHGRNGSSFRGNGSLPLVLDRVFRQLMRAHPPILLNLDLLLVSYSYHLHGIALIALAYYFH